MEQKEHSRLDTGDRFPQLTLSYLDGTEGRLPNKQWTVLIAYRGQW